MSQSAISQVLLRAAPIFLVAAVLLSLCAVLTYAAVQNAERGSANDPQLQVATQAASMLDAGSAPRTIASGPSVDLETSQAVHVSIYGRQNRLLASSARLFGAVPQPPAGVLDSARHRGQSSVTWQPAGGVRVAAVVVAWKGGTVLAGRSLAAVEDREATLGQLTMLGWLAGILVLAATSLAYAWLSARWGTVASTGE